MNLHTRQMAFLGKENQEKLKGTTIAIIGLGALGSASAHLLARMGVGTLILCDDDVVADHNLGRQHLYTVKDIDAKKVEAAKQHLQSINPDLMIVAHDQRIDDENISCCDGASLIIDGVDNHATRRIIDAYAKKKQITWVHGASIEDKGTVVVFDPNRSYETVYEGKTVDQHCSISGVLATATTLTATLQVTLALDVLLGNTIKPVMYRISGAHIEEISL